MSEASVHTGGCLCGAVRFEATGEPTRVGYCHCGMCRKASGQPVAAAAVFPRAAVRIVAGRPRAYRSSAKAFRHFCGDCGSPLFWEAVDGSEMDIGLGVLDRPDLFRPTYHIWTSAALPWLDIADGAPRHPEEP